MAISAAQRSRLILFLLFSLTIILIFSAISLGPKILTKHKTYYCVFQGESIQGLQKGADLKLNGVNIGFVQEIGFDSLDYRKLRITLNIFEQYTIKDDMVGTLEMNGITGLKFINLTGGAPEAAIVEPGGEIATKLSFMADMKARTEVILNKVDTTIMEVNRLISPDSDISQILKNVNYITKDVKEFTDIAVSKIDLISGKVDSTMGHVMNISQNIDNATEEFTQKSDIPKFLNDINETVISLKTLSESLTLTFGQSREDLSATMLDLRETMQNINDLSILLLDNPSILLRGNTSQKRKIK